jgi:glycosyltransferase involved in cell wall biosynthesis
VRTLAVIPAHNEVETLPAVVRELRHRHADLDVLVVDDASTDGTGDLLADLGVRWLQLAQNVGLGGAVRAGLRYARMLGYDSVLRLDADGQHVPDEIHRLLGPIAAGQADAAVGSRFQCRSTYRTSLARRAVHRALAVGLSRLARQPVTDPTSGFWAFGPRALKLLGDHHPRGFSEPELLLFLCRNGLLVAEVPVSMRGRQGGSPSLTLPRAALALARTALAMIVVPLREGVAERRRRA